MTSHTGTAAGGEPGGGGKRPGTRGNPASMPPVNEAQGVKIEEILLDRIKSDAGSQMRIAGLDPATVTDYAAALEEGATFPPIVVFHDGDTYYPADGFHRVEASRRVGRSTILAEVRHGARRDAILHAVGANADHGLPRTQADKRNSVETMLRDPEWARWSDREIGKACRVDHKTVGAVRRELTGEIPTERVYTTRHGTIAIMKTSTFGAKPNGGGSSMVEKMLGSVSDEALIAECGRRGLKVTP